MRAAPLLPLYFFHKGIPLLDIFPKPKPCWVLRIMLNFKSVSEGCFIIVKIIDARILLRHTLSWKLCNEEDVARR